MKRARNLEAATDLLEFGMKVRHNGLNEILTPEALMALFLLFGSKMWKLGAEPAPHEEGRK
jgi:hypothetical protein